MSSEAKDPPAGWSGGVKRHSVAAAKWSLLSRATQLVGPTALGVLLAPGLSPGDFGVVALAASVLSLFIVVQQVGVGQALVQAPVDDPEAAASATWLNVTVAGVSCAVVWMVAPIAGRVFVEPRIVDVLRVLALQLPCLALSNAPQAVLQRRFQYRSLFLIRLLATLAAILSGVGLLLAGFDYWALVVSWVVGALTTTVLAWSFVGLRTIRLLGRPRMQVRSLIRFTWFSILEAVYGWLLVWFDNVCVGRALGTESLGVYALAFNVAVVTIALPLSALTGVSLSSFSRLQADRSALGASYVAGTRVVAAYAVPAGVGLALVTQPVMALLYGPAWTGVGEILPILALYSGFGHLWALNSDAFKAIGRPDVLPRVYGLVLVVVLPAYVLAAPHGLFTFTVVRSLVVPLAAPVHILITARLLGLPRSYLWDCLRAPLVGTVAMTVVGFLFLYSGKMPGEVALSWSVLIFGIVLCVATYVTVLSLVDRPLVTTVARLLREALGGGSR